MSQVVPPRLPQATWAAIDHYLDNPPDWENLKDEEAVVEKPLLTDNGCLILTAQIAEASNGGDDSGPKGPVRLVPLSCAARGSWVG